jgi:hypothetical protein
LVCRGVELGGAEFLHPMDLKSGTLPIFDANSKWRCFMAKVGRDQDFDQIFHKIGPDATATFDNSASNPTEHASSEAMNAATAVDGEDEKLEGEDDDAAELEEDDEENEQEDVEDEAGV